jgi:hypothetical protein
MKNKRLVFMILLTRGLSPCAYAVKSRIGDSVIVQKIAVK